jgi:hypothetical protein
MSEGMLGAALDVRQARLVVIHDAWVGISWSAP